MWAHLFRLIAEMVQFDRKLRRANQADVFAFVNRDETVRAVNSGRPVIVLGGHFGNWEVAASAFGAFGVPVSLVARDLDNPLIHEWFAARRRTSGGRLISKRGGGGEVTEVLEAGGVVGLLADQDAGSRGSSCRSSGRTPARSSRSPCWPGSTTRWCWSGTPAACRTTGGRTAGCGSRWGPKPCSTRGRSPPRQP